VQTGLQPCSTLIYGSVVTRKSNIEAQEYWGNSDQVGRLVLVAQP
jgi:hypothetical protein